VNVLHGTASMTGIAKQATRLGMDTLLTLPKSFPVAGVSAGLCTSNEACCALLGCLSCLQTLLDLKQTPHGIVFMCVSRVLLARLH
jgi:hypothetical protein